MVVKVGDGVVVLIRVRASFLIMECYGGGGGGVGIGQFGHCSNVGAT